MRDRQEKEMSRLEGKVAIVTGAARGTGEQTARLFADEGARVVIADVLEDEGRATAEDIGASAIFERLDVTDEASWKNVVAKTVEVFGAPTVLVNNAGGGGHVSTKYAKDDHFEAAIGLNFRAPFYVTRAAAAYMKEAGGVVLNISSGFSKAANIGSIPYGGAKAALEQMTRMMALEFAPKIRVNAIRVGAVTTENMKRTFLEATPGIGETLASWTPLERLGEPRDIALAALFLCTPASDYITARILPVDGGVVLERSAMELIARADRLSEDS